MEWIKIQKSKYNKSERVSGDKRLYNIYLSPRPYTPTEEENFDTEVLIVRNLQSISTYDIRQQLLKLQEEYDNSEEVNSFTVNGEPSWLKKADRVGLKNSLSILNNNDITSIWLNGKEFKSTVENILKFLKDLELYAMQCYQITQTHIKEIKSIDTRKELFEYDITKDYPEKVKFNIV